MNHVIFEIRKYSMYYYCLFILDVESQQTNKQRNHLCTQSVITHYSGKASKKLHNIGGSAWYIFTNVALINLMHDYLERGD